MDGPQVNFGSCREGKGGGLLGLFHGVSRRARTREYSFRDVPPLRSSEGKEASKKAKQKGGKKSKESEKVLWMVSRG